MAEFDRLRGEPVSEEELARAKDFVVGSHSISRESGASLLGEMLDAWLFGTGLHELDEYERRVRGVTSEGLQTVASRFFRRDHLVEAVVRGITRTV